MFEYINKYIIFAFCQMSDNVLSQPSQKQQYLVLPKAAPPKEVLSPEEAEEREIKLLTGILLSKKDKTAREIIARVTAVLAKKEKQSESFSF